MNIYVDLEATQYSEEIISIGAVTENGDNFYTLVKPKRMRCVTSFITELTGITKQMLQNPDVPNIYDAIHIFAKWCQKQGNNVVIYYYGDFDRVLFSRAFHYLKGITDYSSLGYILNRLVDVSDTLRLLSKNLLIVTNVSSSKSSGDFPPNISLINILHNGIGN